MSPSTVQKQRQGAGGSTHLRDDGQARLLLIKDIEKTRLLSVEEVVRGLNDLANLISDVLISEGCAPFIDFRFER